MLGNQLPDNQPIGHQGSIGHRDELQSSADVQPSEASSRELEEAVERFRTSRRDLGVAQADGQWVRRPFTIWMDNLDNGIGLLDGETLLAFAVGMSETLSIRDAVIVSLVVGKEQCGLQRMVSFACKPHDPRNVRSMYRLLQQAFNDEHVHIDHNRCSTGLSMMSSVADAIPGRFRVQPLAIMGYVCWWLGKEQALQYALQALALDEDCTLAAIVCSALKQGIRPANQRLR
jgi:hypothetical protein